MKNADQLISLVLEAHGGAERWQQLKTIKAHVQMGGITWGVKGQEHVMEDLFFTGDLHEPKDTWHPIFEKDMYSFFDGRNVSLFHKDGSLVEEMKNARESFAGHDIMTPWSRLQLVYFTSYATWNYLTTPFIFLLPGFHFTEIDPWTENGEIWRRIEAIFPDDIPTHSKRQVFYFSEDGLLKRHDYWPEVLGNSSATHYYSDYREIGGVKIPFSHRIYPLDDKQNMAIAEPVLVSIDVKEVTYLEAPFNELAGLA